MIPWPSPREGMALDQLDFGQPNAAVKLFTEKAAASSATLRNERTGDALRFEFDPRRVDTPGHLVDTRRLEWLSPPGRGARDRCARPVGHCRGAVEALCLGEARRDLPLELYDNAFAHLGSVRNGESELRHLVSLRVGCQTNQIHG